MKPSNPESATHKACGHFPYRDWCRACVGGAGAHKRRHEEQNSLLVASMDYGFLIDGDDGEHKIVESSNRLGYPELIVRSDTEPAMLAFRDAVIRELKERFGVRAIAHSGKLLQTG